ncbi:MAG: aldo/keto reductase [Candidatus Dormibacteraceae bacterium]
MNPREMAELGQTGLRVTRLGLGSAPLGGLFAPVSDADAERTVERAYELGLRFFDTAPLYGSGLAEQRVGRALRQFPRDSYVLATKAGRLIRRGAPPEPGQVYQGTPEGLQPVFDFSAEGVRTSVRESLQRLGLDRADVVHLHDPDDHYEQALTEGYPALAELRREGAIGAVGAGMNQAAMEARFLRAAAFDCFLLAGRYTLLDQSGLDELLPLAVDRHASIVAGGVFNSGLLAAPAEGATYDYRPAPPEQLRRAQRLAEVCRNHGLPLPVAAIQFPLGHPAVASVVIGARSAAELEEDVAMFETPVPDALWAELREGGWIRPEAPAPQ